MDFNTPMSRRGFLKTLLVLTVAALFWPWRRWLTGQGRRPEAHEARFYRSSDGLAG